jgi:hypothetical protein
MIAAFLIAIIAVTAGSISPARAGSLEDYVIPSGPHAGQKLIDVVRNDKSHIPHRAIQEAFDFFDRYRGTSRSFKYLSLGPDPGNGNVTELFSNVLTGTGPTIGNPRYMVIFDLDLNSSLPRLHLIDLTTGEIVSVQAAHGKGSECGAGFACKFISDRDSDASPLGFFSTGTLYTGENEERQIGPTIRLNGLEGASNGFSGNDFPSTIVIHGAPYVSNGHAGHSLGCPALNPTVIGELKDKLKDGALFYFYHASLDFNGRSPVVSGLMPTVSTPDTPNTIDADPRVNSSRGTKALAVPASAGAADSQQESSLKAVP